MISISFTLTYLQIYLIVISFFSFSLYAYDKFQSLKSKNAQRVSEKKLLLSSLLGGTIGSMLSMIVFRHKIKKASFLIKFIIVILVQIVIIYFVIKEIL
ncbi:MAG: DUF1294 domain-containing protein [Campylobacterota bacterium]|nr:DUF1294 domain-containing protein [Campylobacterota bacterium]